MNKKLILLALLAVCSIGSAVGKSYKLNSPDKNITVEVDVDGKIHYAVSYKNQPLINSSQIAMTNRKAKDFGNGERIKNVKKAFHDGTVNAVFYKKATIEDKYWELTLGFDNYNLVFRAYNQGVAYRFEAKCKNTFQVVNEIATFNFAKDLPSYVPYVREKGTFAEQFANSFENTYTHGPLSGLNKDRLIFLPILVEAENGVKVAITESDLNDYPGMYLNPEAPKSTTLKGIFAPYPKETVQGGTFNLEMLVRSTEDYIAQSAKDATFPWRIISIAENENELLNDDLVYLLAAPSRIKDTAWIKPGKVAWDWWNDWGLYNVGFKAGINTQTYKAYIDFASKYGLEYVIMDAGWAVKNKADLFQIVPEIDLKAIVDYAEQKHVGIILWAGYYAFERDMEKACRYFSELGVKGFKIDYLNRDDQQMVNFAYRAAEMTAKYHLLVDFHGIYKPTGLNRTFPNVVNFEGVAGQEQTKWSPISKYDQVNYDVTVPYIRMLAGQMDYTQGAMLNGTKKTYYPSYSNPMSQGTRAHQLGMYVVFFSPLNMLCDSPTHYEQEAECTRFISSIPTVWDETVPLEGKVGEYVIMARRKGNSWYVGGLNNWKERTVKLQLGRLHAAGRKAEIYYDGPNAEKMAQDYAKKTISIPEDGTVELQMAPGGGFAIAIL